MGYIEDAKIFLSDWLLQNIKTKLKNDYFELARTAFLFIGGELPAGVKSRDLRAPGAFHHARWMARVIYTLKIALFRSQVSHIFSEEVMEEISSLALFFAVFYSKMWLTCTNAANAALVDLRYINLLAKVAEKAAKNPSAWSVLFEDLMTAAHGKLEKHLSYLSERLLPLCLVSDEVGMAEKNAIRRVMLKHKKSPTVLLQQVPYSAEFKTKSLKDFVGNDSWTLFDLLSSDRSFLRLPAAAWESHAQYKALKKVVSNLPVTNDAAERVLALATEVHGSTAPKDEAQL